MQNSNITIKYHYTSFIDLTFSGECNLYGIIYDASFPIQDEFVESRYECTLKLIDPTVNCLTNPSDIIDKLITLIIKSNDKESIPYVHNIGDIIRIHRGNYVRLNIISELTSIRSPKRKGTSICKWIKVNNILLAGVSSQAHLMYFQEI